MNINENYYYIKIIKLNKKEYLSFHKIVKQETIQ